LFVYKKEDHWVILRMIFGIVFHIPNVFISFIERDSAKFNLIEEEA
jgi:hypothetical protein